MSSDGEHYRRVHEIFDAAREQSGAARSELLGQLCGSDTGLREEVEGLLGTIGNETIKPLGEAAISQLRGSLEGLIGGFDDSPMPAAVARYRVEERIGAGGMGVVYRAVQDSPRRTVALKLLRSGQGAPERLWRFRQESELLGRLQHPGIAQIYEAGTFDLGQGPQPFFAMELVVGLDLAKYSSSQQLPVRQRLELIERVCEAVQHAHDQGVIHRDLKPDNILVDGSGQPKVLDFGIARATEGSDVLTTLLTEEGNLLGTLAYMAPEQLEGRPELITARVDVYALGAILFELLAGRLPHDLVGLPLPAALELAREADPPLLGRLRPELRGDLETIVQKALEREPVRRYATPNDLAADLRAVLQSRPISARPPSRIYRAVKFTRRHRGLVAGTLATLTATLIGMVISIGFAVRASQNESRAREGEQLARAGVLQATQDLIERGEFARAARMQSRIDTSQRTWELDFIEATLPEVLPQRYGAHSLSWLDSAHLLCAIGNEVLILDRQTWGVEGRTEFDAPVGLSRLNGRLACRSSSAMYWLNTNGRGVLHTIEARENEPLWSIAGVQQGSSGLVTVRPSEDGPPWIVQRPGARDVVLSPPAPADSVFRLTPDATQAFYVGSDGTCGSYDTLTGLRTGWIQGARISSCRPIFPSSDSRKVFVYAQGNALLELDAITLQTLLVHDVRSNHSCSIGTLDPDGTRFALDTGHRIALTDLSIGTVHWIDKPAGASQREKLSFSPDGRLLLAKTEDVSARIIDLERPEVRPEQLLGSDDPRCVRFAGHLDFVHELSVSFDGRMVASLSPPDPYVRVWDADTGAPIAELPKPHGTWSNGYWDRGYSLAFSADGRYLVATVQEGNGRPQLWTWDLLEREASLELLDPGLSNMSYLTLLDQLLDRIGPGPAGRLGRSAVRTAAGGVLVAQVPVQPELPPGERWRGVPFSNKDQGLSLDPTGERVALASTREVQIRELDSWDLIAEVPAYVECIAWSPTGDRIAAGTPEGRVLLIDAELRMELMSFQAHHDGVFCLAWTPDGTRLVTGSLDGTLRTWDPRPAAERAAHRAPYEQLLAEHRGLDDAELAGRLTTSDSLDERMSLARVLLERTPGEPESSAPAPSATR